MLIRFLFFDGARLEDLPISLFPRQAQPGLRYIEHAIGVTPLVVEPSHEFEQPAGAHPGLSSVDDRRAGVGVEIDRSVGLFGVSQEPQQASFRGFTKEGVDRNGIRRTT